MLQLLARASAGSPIVLRGPATWPWYLQYLRDPVGCVISIQKRYGDFCALRPPLRLAGPRRTTVFAFGPAQNEQVLGHPEVFRTGGQGIPGPRGSLQSQLRQGLTRMKEPKHKLQRQLVMPTVLKSSVDRYLPAMKTIIAEELDCWHPGGAVNMDAEMRRITMRIAGETQIVATNHPVALYESSICNGPATGVGRRAVGSSRTWPSCITPQWVTDLRS